MAKAGETNYTDELLLKICALIASGLSLRKVCNLPGMPDRQTFYNWMAKYPQVIDQYAQASKTRRSEKFEEIEDIANEEQDVQRARLKIDVIKWQLSKEEPKKYGDRQIVAGDDDSPLTVITKIPFSFNDKK